MLFPLYNSLSSSTLVFCYSFGDLSRSEIEEPSPQIQSNIIIVQNNSTIVTKMFFIFLGPFNFLNMNVQLYLHVEYLHL